GLLFRNHTHGIETRLVGSGDSTSLGVGLARRSYRMLAEVGEAATRGALVNTLSQAVSAWPVNRTARFTSPGRAGSGSVDASARAVGWSSTASAGANGSAGRAGSSVAIATAGAGISAGVVAKLSAK